MQETPTSAPRRAAALRRFFRPTAETEPPAHGGDSSARDGLATVTDPPTRSSRGTATFLRRVLTRQSSMGALAPTSTTLAVRLASLIPPSANPRVLELGSGTGAISGAIGARLGPGGVHVALERDPALLAHVEHVAPHAVRVAGDAADLRAHLAAVGIGQVDVVISSLPWSRFSPDVARRILDAVCSVLAPGGSFATIAYRPSRLNPRSRRFRRLLGASFAEVAATGTTWASVPPARLLVCGRPLPETRRD